MNKPLYINWLVEETEATTNKGQNIYCYNIDYQNDDEVLNDWALHLRRHYSNDKDTLDSAKLYDLNVKDYLKQYIIPQLDEPFGPTARSNDITEIIFADLLQFVLNYSVPRCKQYNRSGKNNSEHGTDVVAYKFSKENKIPCSSDELIAAEVKAELTVDNNDKVLESAIGDSVKDHVRLARTIDYYRKKLTFLGKDEEASDITRFLLKPEYNFQVTYIAAGFNSKNELNGPITVKINGEDLLLENNQKLFYIHGKKLMDLTNEIYARCVKWSSKTTHN